MSTTWYLSELLRLLMAFPFLRPPSPSKRQAVGSIVSPTVSTPSALAESGGSGSARGQGASGQRGPEVCQAEEIRLEAIFSVSVTVGRLLVFAFWFCG